MSEAIKILPEDKYNLVLVNNTHPKTWKNPQPKSKYHLVVIGAGTAGLVSAIGAANLGAKVAIIEKYLTGGDCLNFGCVPSKAIINASKYFVDRNPTETDFESAMEQMRNIRAKISHHDSVERLSKIGIDVFLGKGSFINNNTISVNSKVLKFKKAIIATGARASTPNINGIKEIGYLTNETVFSMTKRPKRLAVIGGGPIGCELAQAFARLGSEVTLIHKYDNILNKEDEDVSEIIQNTFIKDGIHLVLGCSINKVEKQDNNKIIHFATKEGKNTITVDEILISIGRSPNVEELSLEKANVNYDKRRGIIVNGTLRTTNPNIYAAGDICMKYKFTHAADAAARIVIQNSLFMGRKKISKLTIPWCTYTDPEVAHVGINEKEAKTKDIDFQTFTKRMNEIDRAITDNEENGFIKILTKKGTDKILGATIVAKHAGEMINEITLAMATKTGLGTIANIIHPYPTYSLGIKQTGDAYNNTKLTHFVKKLLSGWLKFTI